MRVINSLVASLEYWSFDFPPGSETDFEDSLGGAWYITPTHHAIEFITLAPIFLLLTGILGMRAFGKGTTGYRLLTTPQPTDTRSSWLDQALLIMTIGSLGLTVIHKYYTHTLLFLLQPCHASAAILIIIMGWPLPNRPFIPRLLFNIYLHTMWGAILALVFPDLRDHDMFGEVFNFFLEHILILIVPFYLLSAGRCVLLPASADMALFSFFLYAAYHSPLLHILSLSSGYNLNYTLVPPALGFLIAVGPWYRIIMYGTALLNMFWTRYGLVGSFVALVCNNNSPSSKKAQ